MTTAKKYDTTIARVAGNIASGMIANREVQKTYPSFDDLMMDAVKFARRLVKQVEAEDLEDARIKKMADELIVGLRD